MSQSSLWVVCDRPSSGSDRYSAVSRCRKYLSLDQVKHPASNTACGGRIAKFVGVFASANPSQDLEHRVGIMGNRQP